MIQTHNKDYVIFWGTIQYTVCNNIFYSITLLTNIIQ